MTDSVPPRVEVVLPGGRQALPAQLHAQRRDGDGRWWCTVAIEVPAAGVRRVDGEDYDQVPVTRDPPGYVLEGLPKAVDGAERLVLHTADCWSAGNKRVTTAPIDKAQFFLRHGWAEPCEVCKPEL